MGFGLDLNYALSGLTKGVQLGGAIDDLKNRKEDRARQTELYNRQTEQHEMSQAVAELRLEALQDAKTRETARQKLTLLKGLSGQITEAEKAGKQISPELIEYVKQQRNELFTTTFAPHLNSGGVKRQFHDFVPSQAGGYHAAAVGPDGKPALLNDKWTFDESAPPMNFRPEDLEQLGPNIEATLEFLGDYYQDPDRAEKREDAEFKHGLDIKRIDHEYDRRLEVAKSKGGGAAGAYKPTREIQNMEDLRERFPNLTDAQILQLTYDDAVTDDIIESLDPEDEAGAAEEEEDEGPGVVERIRRFFDDDDEEDAGIAAPAAKAVSPRTPIAPDDEADSAAEPSAAAPAVQSSGIAAAASKPGKSDKASGPGLAGIMKAPKGGREISKEELAPEKAYRAFTDHYLKPGKGRKVVVSPQKLAAATKVLLKDPSPEAQKEFDATFGIPGEAADIIKKNKGKYNKVVSGK